MPKRALPSISSFSPLVLLPALIFLPTQVRADGDANLAVFKDPSCGCCAKWVKHMENAGFSVTVHDQADMPAIKKREGIPPNLGSCHTAVIGGYKIEGHVPADVVRRLLIERPKVSGIAVPGMPMGSPGMEGPTKSAYEIVSFGGLHGQEVFDRR